MSGDHNTGWRKRQIALDIKAENARALGLDYEPDITIEMAREAGAVFPADGSYHQFERHEDLEAFAALVRADEREACAKIVEVEAMQYAEPVWAFEIVNDIRARGQA